MKIGFVNLTPLKYDVTTPYNNPLGGSESALCYLSEHLAKRAHKVILFARYSHAFRLKGVVHQPDFALRNPNEFNLDALIIQNTPHFGPQIKLLLRGNTKLIFWSEHDYNQPAVFPLTEKLVKNSFDKFVFVSNWQKENYLANFNLDKTKCHVIRNAMSPAFENLFSDTKKIPSRKTYPPVLAYTSTPFRGLDILIRIFPEIRKRVPGTKLKVFSSMQVYQKSQEEDHKTYGHLYKLCKKTEGVEFMGSISQTKLAKEMSKVSILAYPNTFPETSCISVMEAMAAGCQVITTELGALPETTSGFAKLIRIDGNWKNYSQEFIAETVKLLKKYSENRQNTLSKKLEKQVEFMNKKYVWSKIAIEWERLISMIS